MSGSILYYCHNWVHQLLIGYSLVKLLHGWLTWMTWYNCYKKYILQADPLPFFSMKLLWFGSQLQLHIDSTLLHQPNMLCFLGLFCSQIVIFINTRVEVKLSVWLPKWMSSKGVVSSLFMAPSLWSFGPKKAALNCFCCLLGRCHSVCKIHNIPFVFVQSVLDLLCQ